MSPDRKATPEDIFVGGGEMAVLMRDSFKDASRTPDWSALIVGISPRRTLDDDYKGFLDLVLEQVTMAIALTADAGEFDQRKALQSGFQDITKPMELEELVKAIARLCGWSRGRI
ncbi:hypothetical protein FNW02_23110 [Komarekiella sp. 'clone 1']|uniref:Uncharacterized protein n=1 Tax=Komarekiella delphini-convector SJRDD-AB1 TaxID=2593771 RepID=A0AA40T138_9NOST|nr:hypothetical protein [Komarekiella delphini-convector]MBD6618637.1 hypothetical protein [Komarekiella delphini-convector SJRDD-AB1]